MRKPVFMCVCNRKSFSDILDIAKSRDMQTVEELKNAGVCATNCQMCRPYVERALITGETSFNPGDIYHRSG
jgi:bacterioferritin-associated ferredoxin